MLTRLKVSGFKNLVDVDIAFGPFTCIAGANGVGKSNLFDAIRFLSALADQSLIDAALSVRDEGGRTGDIRSLFHRAGDVIAPEMSFIAEMIVPSEGVDDLGQLAKASITFLNYTLVLAYRKDENVRSLGAIELVREELTHINLGAAREHLSFAHSPSWRNSTILGRRTSPFISTEIEGPTRVIKLHQDGGTTGRPRQLLAANLPRTVLSAANAAESPTALMARREMRSWRLLQLEPSALRRPDSFDESRKRLSADGSHLAATLYHLAQPNDSSIDEQEAQAFAAQTYATVSNRLAQLIDDVREVWIDRDERRELLTLYVKGRDQTSHPARALSDGTLRFLALTVLDLDTELQGLICLEEPENGIHPERIPAMLSLLQDIATQPNQPIGPENPLRQIIVNTHSPAVVQQVQDDSLLVAEAREVVRDGRRFKRVSFGCLPDTWRVNIGTMPIVARGKLLAYLNPVMVTPTEDIPSNQIPNATKPLRSTPRRVIDRPDLQLMLPFSETV